MLSLNKRRLSDLFLRQETEVEELSDSYAPKKVNMGISERPKETFLLGVEPEVD